MEDHNMTQAEKETIETFCRELALALRRITGKKIDIRPDMLAAPVEEPSTPGENQTPPEKHDGDSKS